MFWLLTWSSGKDVSGIQNINTIKKRQGKQKKQPFPWVYLLYVQKQNQSWVAWLYHGKQKTEENKQTVKQT